MPKSREAAVAIATLKYEDAIAELERLIQSMEAGQLTLEASLGAYERGAQLLRHCQQQLDAAESRLQVLDGDQLRPLALDAEKTA